MPKSNNPQKIKYYTRSVTSQFEKSYNFDLASIEWNKNKIKKKNCVYQYINS